MPQWLVMAVFAALCFVVAWNVRSVVAKVVAGFFGAILGFFALKGAVATWWVWLIVAVVGALYVTMLIVKRRAKKRKEAEERARAANTNNFFFGPPPGP